MVISTNDAVAMLSINCAACTRQLTPPIQERFFLLRLALASGFLASGLKSPSVLFSGQTENAGHFLQLATIAMGHSVMVRSFPLD